MTATNASMSEAWQALKDHHRTLVSPPLRSLFEEDENRFDRFSREGAGLLLDVSKVQMTGETLDRLVDLVRAAGVEERREAMFSGSAINTTEERVVLHTALRNRADVPVELKGVDVMPQVAAVLARMSAFADAVRKVHAGSHTDTRFTDVVNIGIGGSDLGPAMATAALAPYHDGPRLHFVSNIDGAHLADTVKGLDPRSTLFLIASKTFTTAETMTNAASARRWIVENLGEPAVKTHFAAISTALDKVDEFGIPHDRVFGFWDWVGGRYSLWSAIGLPLIIAIGPERFQQFLAGGRAMDAHFREAPIADNLPMLLGLVGILHRNVCGYPTRAILPYDQRMRLFPNYIQQLDMESNGKRVTLSGEPAAGATGPVVWGGQGTNGQHAFFQLLHQGTDVIPAEFMVAAQGHEPRLRDHHAMLLANCLAQSAALMRGRTLEEAKAQLEAAGKDAATIERLAPHKIFPGNRPSTTLLYDRLDPETLGKIIALYEHRVFVEGTIRGINSFDQWGVELGKELATALLPAVKTGTAPEGIDGSTRGLLAEIGKRSD
ncbi:glucose-6-phosphate isomerase [Breoghania sp.]|uniref:glucose-6-phosphate isomerase n=1 Tax=Breoghania sp. TaxID=2065378 RepID=UPI0026278D8E|nr:glucose-6-phosphate isomerase [Breoghania sp.]MDJ0931214.1 glucose-6-phosphate isomerase [Breoghania sp.]